MDRNFNTEIQNLNPHYTQEYFKEPRTIWGTESTNLQYDYSDRLIEWDYNKSKLAMDIPTEFMDINSKQVNQNEPT